MNDSADLIRDEPSRSIIGVLKQLDRSAGEDGLSVAAIVDRLDERAFGLLALLLTLPCLAPGLPGAQIIAVPIFLLSVQMLIGRREPWLPGWFLRVQVKKSWIAGLAEFADKRLRWGEALARPRLGFLAAGLGERVVALFMSLAAITIMLPITNTFPSAALTLMCIGIIQRDGLFALAGMLAALAWLAALGVLVAGLFFGAGFAVELVNAHAPWLLRWMGR